MKVFFKVSLASVILIATTVIAANKPQMPTIVSVTKAKIQHWQPEMTSIGTLHAYHGAILKAETSGRITQLFAHSGQTVKKDQPILDIFPAVLKAQLMQQKAQLLLDQKTYQRYKTLSKHHYVSQETLDQAAAKWQSSHATVQSTRAQLTQHRIRAPFDGKLGLIMPSVGDYVTPGDELASLQQVKPLYVDFALSGRDIARLQVGNRVKIESRAYPHQSFTGKIIAINSSIDPDTGMISVRANVPNDHEKLLPGAFVNVTVYEGSARDVVVVPQTAINYDPKANFVYTMNKEHKVTKRPIKLGPQVGDSNIVVLSGLTPNASVIVGGQMKLHDGDTVITLEEAQSTQKKQAT